MAFARRNFINGLVGVIAMPITSAAASPNTVSLRMAGLIAKFVETSAALEAIDCDESPMAWEAAAKASEAAFNSLVYEHPASLADFAAKMDALAKLMSEEDSELHVFRQLAEDARLLAEAG
ncbi:hypothetical protein JL101_036320 (plasmid) [Skermanella rosea]|uniref:hypothetical protein n=1 Tax=Skermanella rosea TaxID=1817965 RepID=UPI001932A7A5|nr:hypothetical protein [Skermanella rosea]UEM08162.1 hypothetical protein JL101_036320 [Skermanella rosea]